MINTVANEARSVIITSFVSDKRDCLDNVDISVTSKQSGGLKMAGNLSRVLHSLS